MTVSPWSRIPAASLVSSRVCSECCGVCPESHFSRICSPSPSTWVVLLPGVTDRFPYHSLIPFESLLFLSACFASLRYTCPRSPPPPSSHHQHQHPDPISCCWPTPLLFISASILALDLFWPQTHSAKLISRALTFASHIGVIIYPHSINHLLSFPFFPTHTRTHRTLVTTIVPHHHHHYDGGMV